MEVEEQEQRQSAFDMQKTMMMEQAKTIFSSCTKKCITRFDKPDLNDKEKICLSKCYDRKLESFYQTARILQEFSEAAQKQSGSDF